VQEELKLRWPMCAFNFCLEQLHGPTDLGITVAARRAFKIMTDARGRWPIATPDPVVQIIEIPRHIVDENRQDVGNSVVIGVSRT